VQFALQLCGYVVGLPLELLIIAALVRGPYKRFPILFAYTIVTFLTTVVEIPANIAYYRGDRQALRSRAFYYWFNERVLLVLLFLVVVTLIWHATAHIRSRKPVRLILIVGPILFASASFLIHYNPNATVQGEWMTPWTRDLNFGSAVLDLGLWTLLIASRGKDRLLLMLSGALGIQFTGEAIGGSIRSLAVAIFGPTAQARPLLVTGNILIMAANLVCMYIWWQAFREARAGALQAYNPPRRGEEEIT
jgi:hypothetical protein